MLALAGKILTCYFHSLLDVLEAIHYLQKVQYSTGVFLRQWNLVGCSFFKLRFEHSLEHWRVQTQYQTMNMKLLILYHKNYVSTFPRLRKAMLYYLFCLVTTYTDKKGLFVINAICTPPLSTGLLILPLKNDIEYALIHQEFH